ncbi:MAG: radical SAM family heme chaperone HemW [Isosphaeraceae bacterium]
MHIPFCSHKCGYCDFASLAGVDHLAGRYLEALEAEIAGVASPQPMDTLFVGGGTPTRLTAGQLERLLGVIRQWLPLVPGGEWTVEANPETIDAEKADVLAAGGVNRVSLGAQSFHAPSLAVLEREHTPDSVPRALELVRPRFERWSFDLIFGVPGSTPEIWRADLGRALDLGPSHLSCYGLTFEKGTALHKQWREGRVSSLDEEVERTLLADTIDRLSAEGLPPYEISNYARPGQECRHNLVYWANDAYYGFGVGAARYVGGERTINTRDLLSYLRRIEAGQPVNGPKERLDSEGRARETAVLMLRRTQLGLERDDFRLRTGYDLEALAGPAIAKHVGRGNFEDDGHRLRLTREGLFIADSVLADLL